MVKFTDGRAITIGSDFRMWGKVTKIEYSPSSQAVIRVHTICEDGVGEFLIVIFSKDVSEIILVDELHVSKMLSHVKLVMSEEARIKAAQDALDPFIKE